ncbi:MAG: hypothetical protein HFH85_16840 [Lachnospiraceae bacterium]|jgi:hypothetical protein|nr:hypothetical protein [Lachnospiraceae bacterium]
MFDEQRKTAKVVAELTMFFLSVGADKIDFSVEKKGNQEVITFRGNYLPEEKGQLQALKALNEQKNDGIEDIYWELAGSGNYGETSELLLVGMMVDKAETVIEDGFVSLTLYREMEN